MSQSEIEAHRHALFAQAELQREADHRVKNNLQLISSLVLLHGRRTTDAGVKRALKAVQQRIIAVSLAHRHVTRTGGVEEVEFAGLIRELVGDLAASAGRDGIQIALDLEPVGVPARNAAALALIVNEAVVNALTHAFPDARNGRVSVTLSRTPAGYDFVVTDDGVGADSASPGGFGRTILQLLAQQLHARLETSDAQPGLRLAVSVPEDRTQP